MKPEFRFVSADRQFRGILANSLSSGIRRAIVHHNHFKAFCSLMFLQRGQACLRELKLIEYRNDD